ncbi:hypothetical protein PR048_023698 [Dryococelus australis]|uniref:PiggyBac transposable element-derived protein domain-containing protein n=1 Tax=Dryococelus australis TaxID=614101 RepID=A0ABQ9GUV3_9NEOP|nr:hypothetical protein PR048_023698 [Dryococelus australis]
MIGSYEVTAAEREKFIIFSCGLEQVMLALPCLEELNIKKQRKDRTLPRWKKCDTFEKVILSSSLDPLAVRCPELALEDPFEVFLKILPEQYLEYVARMTSLYAHQKGFEFDEDWKDIAEDLDIPLVPKVMPRNKFREIKTYLHFMDSTELGKIQPIFEELNKNLQQFGIFHKDLSINESMVPYYGYHSCKMFIRGKRIRSGPIAREHSSLRKADKHFVESRDHGRCVNCGKMLVSSAKSVERRCIFTVFHFIMDSSNV